MKTKEDEKYNQSRRCLKIYKLFLRNRSMTSKEVINEINDSFPGYSDRSIQRDLKILADEGFIERNNKGKNSDWNICNRNDATNMPLKLRESELLSFYILKSYLKTFSGTSIEKDINHLTEILETFAPGNVIMEEQFYGDQNIGTYDYSKKQEIIRLCIKNINEKNWIDIQYARVSDGKSNQYHIFPEFLFTFAGTIYLVAYNPKYKTTNNYVLHNIITVSESLIGNYTVPKFDYLQFRKQRFAVIADDISHVVLKIEKDFVKYFENRNWHPTQKIIYNPDDTMTICMDVPLSEEFIGWILNWNEGIVALEPPELVDNIVRKLNNIIKNYKK